MLASPLPEARHFATMILEELKKVMPSFVARVERPDRGGEWISYLERRREAAERWVARMGLDRPEGDEMPPSVELIDVDGSEDDLIAASLFESAGTSERAILDRVRALPPDEQARDDRRPRRRAAEPAPPPRPRLGGGRYRFEIVSDYGGFRDLQRHRMLTCQWQRLSPDLGAGIPDEVREAGAGDEYERALEISRVEYDRLAAAGLADAAPYALCLGYRIRYVLDLNAREAMHLIELRSGREGHPDLPRSRAGDARADRLGPPGDRRGDDPRRRLHRAPARADHERDPHPSEAGRRRAASRSPPTPRPASALGLTGESQTSILRS